VKHPFWLVLVAAVVAMLIALPFGVTAHFQSSSVVEESMLQALLPGDRLLVDKYFSFREPRIGDLVIFRAPSADHEQLVKRIIGVPGDQVSLKGHDVYLNCRPDTAGCAPLAEPWAYFETTAWPVEDRAPIRVPPGEYWVMADNRNVGEDSRHFGFVSREAIVGRAVFIYWSYSPSDGVRWRRLARLPR
jgi:signal peptidase I